MTPLIVSKFGIWTLTTVDVISLIAATTNAFNGALLARRPDHYKHFTVIGIIILAYAGGIGGGIVRDVLVNKIPSPLENPWYLIFCFTAAALALLIDYSTEQRFKDGLFQFMTAFSLPWYAIVGAQAALQAHLGYLAAVIIGVIATTAGRWIIDVACLVVPKQLVRGENLRARGDIDRHRVRRVQSNDRAVGDTVDGDRIRGWIRFPADVAGAGLGRVGAVGTRAAHRRREGTQAPRRGTAGRVQAR